MMQVRIKVCLLAVAGLLGLAQQAGAASFNCDKAKSLLEKTICSSPELDAADTRMGEAYREAVKAFPVQGFVPATQKMFLRSTYASCVGDERSAKKPEAKRLADCLEAAESRIRVLNEYQTAKVYSESRKFDPEGMVFTVFARNGKTMVRYFGSWMPDAFRPKPYPDGFICDDESEVKVVKGVSTIEAGGDEVPVKIADGKFTLGAFISCSPRNGIGEGDYSRVK
jgi:uncharacterized protein